MRVSIHPAENAINVDGLTIRLSGDKMPVGPALAGFSADATRPIDCITFDGVVGRIQRVSRVPSMFDFEHFLGADPLKPYIDVHAAEAKRLADEKAARDAAIETANLAHQAAFEVVAKA